MKKMKTMGSGWLGVLAMWAMAACAQDTTGVSGQAEIALIDCASGASCPDGYECEIEQEHGSTTSFCKLHGFDDDAAAGNGADGGPVDCGNGKACPAGFECEIEDEHGAVVTYCKLHSEDDNDDGAGSGAANDDGQGNGSGGDDGAGSGSDTSGAGNGQNGAACAADGDCSAGLECEVEEEQGQTTGICQPHNS